jgi:beta-lactamase regulating signal transducer with metallopeptidase domain
MNSYIDSLHLLSLASVWSDLALDITLKGSLILVLIGLTCLAFKGLSASTRHLLWTLGIGAVLLLPVFSIGLPDWPVKAFPRLLPVPRQLTRIDIESDVQGQNNDENESVRAYDSLSEAPVEKRTSTLLTESQTVWDIVGWLMIAWLVGTLFLLSWFIVGTVSLGSLVRKATLLNNSVWNSQARFLAEKMSFKRRMDILRSDKQVTPMSWGIWNAKILLPAKCEEWTEEQRREVLVHEISHLSRRDCLTQTFAIVVCVLNWFNPLVWFAGARMRTERERACDDQVILAGSKPSMYAENLLDIALSLASERRSSYISVAMARRSEISGRLMAVLDPKIRRGVWGPLGTLSAGILMLVLVLPLAAMSPGRSETVAVPSFQTASLSKDGSEQIKDDGVDSFTSTTSSSLRTKKTGTSSNPSINTKRATTMLLKWSDIQKSIEDIDSLLSQAQVTPHHAEDGSLDGLWVSNIKKGSIYVKMGLKNGDIIKGMNDNPMTRIDDILSLYERLKTGSNFFLNIMRDGQEIALNLRIR